MTHALNNVAEDVETGGRMDSSGNLQPTEHTESHATPQPTDIDAKREIWWERCKALANELNILDGVIRTVRALGAVEVDRLVSLIYLAVTSRFLQRPVSLVIQGPSSAGKSFPLQQTLKLFPPEAYDCKTATSERALAYSEESLEHRMLIFFEEAGLGNDFALYLMRSLLSEGRIRYETVEKTSGGLKSRVIERQGPTGLIVTTTQQSIHAENDTRMLSITVADTPEQTRAIFRALAGRQRAAIDLEPWLALQQWLGAAEHQVEIPFALVLADLVSPVAIRLRRDFGTVLNLVSAHALLHQANRERNADGHIVATFADYAAVYGLVADLIADGVEATVSDTIRETVAVVKNNKLPMTVADVGRSLGLDKSSAWRRVQTALEKGYLVNIETERGRSAKLIAGDPLPDDVEILPAVDALVEGCRVAAKTGDTPKVQSQSSSRTLGVE